MRKYGYTKIGRFFRDKSYFLFKKTESISSDPKNYCMVIGKGLRTDCEGVRYEIGCTNRPYVRLTLPRKDSLLKKYMNDENLIEVNVSLKNKKKLYQSR